MSDDHETANRSEHRPRLGRGLAALLGSNQDSGGTQAAVANAPRRAPIEFLRPNPKNPRKRFNDEELAELAESIKERGVIQPVLVRPILNTSDIYEIVAGERRWRAAQKAGQHDIPIIVLEVGDREALEIAIVENIQRADLNALEEAAGFAQLGSEYGYSHSDIARVVGKSRSHVANTLRLTNLPEYTREMLAAGHISAGHARALLSLDDPNGIADRIVERGLTVRDVERLGQGQVSERAKRERRGKGNMTGPDTIALQDKLQLALGTKVTVIQRGESGELRIAFRGFDQLDQICRRLSNPAAG